MATDPVMATHSDTKPKTALVICPGRGTYNRDELGYLARHHADKRDLVASMDAVRADLAQDMLSDLDGMARYSSALHERGDNASALIFASAYADFLSIDRAGLDVVAVTGNSMGWYIALACAGALDGLGGFTVANTMGRLMQETGAGGQIVYPFVDKNWVEIPERRQTLLDLAAECPGIHVSIHLGGMLVFAGEGPVLDEFERRLEPVQGRFPMRLRNHAAYHTPLQEPVSRRGLAALPEEMFSSPGVPLIDGRGHVWLPRSSDCVALRDYTLGHQVTRTYDFAAAIRSGLHEFAPDCVIILGPGTTLFGAVAQCLIADGWFGLRSKADITLRQAADPAIIAMGMDRHRSLATGARCRNHSKELR